MNDLWKKLVKEPVAVVDQNFDNIMDELLKNIVGREWRVRQASCAAIADLVQGKPVEKYEKYLNDIWTLTYKVLYTSKQTFRTAYNSGRSVMTSKALFVKLLKHWLEPWQVS